MADRTMKASLNKIETTAPGNDDAVKRRQSKRKGKTSHQELCNKSRMRGARRGKFSFRRPFPGRFFVNDVKRLRIPEAKDWAQVTLSVLTISRIGNDGFDGRLLLPLHGPETH